MQRREFLKKSKQVALGLGVGTVLLRHAGSVRGIEANRRISLALIGCGGRGSSLAAGFLARGDCEIAYLADCDSRKFASADAWAQRQNGRRPTCVQDLRKALDDKSVDAVVIATPDHWHALAAIWACQAGKDVYVEKPASHNGWEGRKMVEAARKYRRIVQVGMQNRSAPYNLAAKRYIEEGKLNEIHLCRVYNQKGPVRSVPSIRHQPAPETLDWDMWNGPAPESPYSPDLHANWHAWWRYSGGDMANDGVHQLDLARWLCGAEHPRHVYCTGGSFAGGGVRDVPDTQTAVYDFDNLTMTFEMTLYGDYMLKTDSFVRDNDLFPYWMQNATRIELFGTKGLMVVGRHGGGWQVFVRPKNREPVVQDQAYGRFPDREHKENFLQSVRTRELPNADVEQGHRSALMVHYANISLRLGGRKLSIDPKTGQFIGDDRATELFGREYRAPWAVPENV